jgi:flagellar basal body-associated protein FliL
MQPELERLEKEEKRKQTGARLAFERISKQRRFLSRTALIAVVAVAFSVVSLLLIALMSFSSFSVLFAPSADEGAGMDSAGIVVLAAIAIAILFLLALAGFGIYILIWSSKKKAALTQEEQAIRNGLDNFHRDKEIFLRDMGE